MHVETNIEELVAHPKNPNKHSREQITRLAQLIQYQGWRLPIIVSNQTGWIVSGHGRLEAAKELGLKTVPVSFQDFLDEAQEIAFLVSDNAIASWAELDLGVVNSFLPDLGPTEIEMLGLPDFKVEPAENEPEPKPKDKKPVQCPNCGEQFV